MKGCNLQIKYMSHFYTQTNKSDSEQFMDIYRDRGFTDPQADQVN